MSRFQQDDAEMVRRELRQQPVRLPDPIAIPSRGGIRLGIVRSAYPTSFGYLVAGGDCVVELLEDLPKSATLLPTGISLNTGWTAGTGAGTPGAARLTESPDIPIDTTNNTNKTTVANSSVFYTLTTVPFGFDSALQAELTIRLKNDGGGALRFSGAQIFESDRSTPITEFTPITDSTDWQNQTVNLRLVDDPAVQTAAVWNGAVLNLKTDAGVGGSVFISVARVKVWFKRASFTVGDMAEGTPVASGKFVIAHFRINSQAAGSSVWLYEFPWGWEVIKAL